MLMRNHTPFPMKQHLIKNKILLKLESSIFKNLWSFSCFKLPPQHLRLDFLCFKPLTVPELEVYIACWCQAFLTSAQGTLNWSKIPTHTTCSFSLQEEWDRETIGFFLSLLDGRNGNLHFKPFCLPPGCPSCVAAAETRTSPSAWGSCWAVGGNTPVWGAGEEASFPAPLGNCFLCLGWVCLSSPWFTPERWGVMAQPTQLGWELFLAGSGAFRVCSMLPTRHWAPTGHQSSEQAQRGLGWTPEWTVEPCLLLLQGETEQCEKQYSGLHFEQGVFFILLLSVLWRKLERND